LETRSYTRADILNLAGRNPCLFRYNFWTLGAATLSPILVIILAFSPPSSMPVFAFWILLLLLAVPLLWLVQAMMIPHPMAAAIVSLRHGKGAIWLAGDQLHFFDQVVAIEQVDYLARTPKYGFGDFILHMTDGREITFPDAFVIRCFELS
jgi:hypothetical protein